MIATTANGPGMPVVLYLRKSNKTKSKSRDETVSIQQQRKELLAFCESRGWIIGREYVDDGKSASRNEHKRFAFAKLLADVKARGDFRAIVVWDLSRLTRRDSVDAGNVASTVKAANLLIESMRDGEIDLNHEMGRHMWNLHAEGNASFAKKISAGVIRGRKDAIDAAKWPHGKIPYGYDRQYWDGGTLVSTLHRNASAGKARHWTTKIIPNAVEAPIATRIIRDYASRDVSLRGLAATLQGEGVPPPNGTLWKPIHVKTIVACPIYTGDLAVGYGQTQKYETLARSVPQRVKDKVPALIDRPTWDRANSKLASQAESGRRVHTGKASPLSGIVYCGHCGRSMSKNTKKGVTRFVCATAAKNRNNPTCKQWTVQEADLLPIFTQQLVKTVDFSLLESLAATPPAADTQQLARLEQQETDLAKQVATAARNFALAEPEFREDVKGVLMEIKAELDKVRNTAHIIRTAADKTQLQRAADWWNSTRQNGVTLLSHTWTMRDEDGTIYEEDGSPMVATSVMRADPDTFRDLLKRLNARITLHFTPKAQGEGAKKQYYALEWGRLEASLDGNSLDATG